MSRPHPDHLADLEPALLDALLDGLAPASLPVERKRALRGRVLATIGPTGEAVTLKAEDGPWLPLLPGIAIKPLRIDRRGNAQTSLWRLAPGARVPEHHHHEDEECLIVEGTIDWAGKLYHRGDYLLAQQGLHHTEFHAPEGALLLIRSELSPPLDRLFAAAGL